jgi:hypothetical protein
VFFNLGRLHFRYTLTCFHLVERCESYASQKEKGSLTRKILQQALVLSMNKLFFSFTMHIQHLTSGQNLTIDKIKFNEDQFIYLFKNHSFSINRGYHYHKNLKKIYNHGQCLVYLIIKPQVVSHFYHPRFGVLTLSSSHML